MYRKSTLVARPYRPSSVSGGIGLHKVRSRNPVAARRPAPGEEVAEITRKEAQRRMKTLWSSCNSRRRTVRLNSELAQKPRECLEYIVVHEMAHAPERSHGPRFVALMDRHLPNWCTFKARLNRLPRPPREWDALIHRLAPRPLRRMGPQANMS